MYAYQTIYLLLGTVSALLIYNDWIISGFTLGIITIMLLIDIETEWGKKRRIKREKSLQKNKEKEKVKIIKETIEKLKPLISEFNKQKKVVLKIFEKFNVYKNEFLKEYKSADAKVTPDDFYELVKDFSKELKDIGKNEDEDYLFQCSQIKSFLVESYNNIKKIHKLIKGWDGGKWESMYLKSDNQYSSPEVTESSNIEKFIEDKLNDPKVFYDEDLGWKIDRNSYYQNVELTSQLRDWINEMKENSYFSEQDGKYNLNSRLQKRNQSLINLINTYKETMEFYHYGMYLSLNYLLAIINSDIMGANDIYITLDRLNIFNKNWENEVLNKLQNIEDKLDDLISVVEESTKEIVNSINNLSFSITDSLNSLKGKVQETNRLQKWNNLYTAIGSYQTYKLNK